MPVALELFRNARGRRRIIPQKIIMRIERAPVDLRLHERDNLGGQRRESLNCHIQQTRDGQDAGSTYSQQLLRNVRVLPARRTPTVRRHDNALRRGEDDIESPMSCDSSRLDVITHA